MPARTEKKILAHPLLNPEGNSYSYQTPEADALKGLSAKEVINLITGRYGHWAHGKKDIAESLQGHPAVTPKNIDIALRSLGSDDDSLQHKREIARHFPLSPKTIHKMIENPDDYGLDYAAETGSGKKPSINHAAQILANQDLTPEHKDKIISQENPFYVEAPFANQLDINQQKKLIHNPHAKIDPSAIKALLDGSAVTGHLNHDDLETIINNHRVRLPASTFEDLIGRMKPEHREDYLNKILGIKGGKHSDEDYANDPEANWDNWDHGLDHDSKLQELAAESKYLSPDQAEHLMRHSNDFDTRWNLFHNKNLGSHYADQMYSKWLDDDHRHGYDLDEFKERLKEENPMDYDDWYEEAREKAEEEYPISDYIKDNYRDDDYEGLVGTSRQDHIDSKLEDHDWERELDPHEWVQKIQEHDTRNQDWQKMLKLAKDKDTIHKKDMEEAGINPDYFPYSFDDENEDDSITSDDLLEEIKKEHPPVIDHAYEGTIDEHPEYQDRYDEADADFDAKIEDAKRHPPDHVYDGYSDSISERESELARELYDEKMDNAHEDEEFLPDHLSAVSQIRAKRAEEEAKKAQEKAKAKELADKPHLDKYIPNRPNTHEYGEGQHHIELAKEYADANGGKVDVGYLNKMHPNMVERWKKIFNGKGKLSSEELQQKIDELPKQKYNLSYQHWKPDDMQNLNGQDEMVIRLDHSPETLAEIKKDPEAFDVFNKINEASQRSGHPTNHNTIGWVRADFTDPKHPFIDELQSDFGSAVRDYLKEHGGEAGAEKAKHLDKIIAINKNWRETLINAVKKIAKQHGAETLSTHSPESKSAHTGASKVHSVYKDSYEKIPRQMGFKPADMDSLPLSTEGKKTFTEGRTGKDADELISQHLEGMGTHGFLANAHRQLSVADVPVDGSPSDLTDIHKEMADAHQEKFKAHLERIKQLDPTHEAAKFRTFNDYSKWHMKGLEGGEEEKNIHSMNLEDAAKHAQANKDGSLVGIPVYGFDSALKEQTKVDGYHGHSLPLNQEAFKKSIAVADFLMKSMGNNDKMAVAQALSGIQQQQEQIEALKEVNPEAYQAIAELTQVLVDLFKELNDEPIEAVQHELEAQQQMQEQQPQQAQQQEQGAQQEVAPPPQDQPITHGDKTLPPGAIRDYQGSTGAIRQKTPDGNWIGIKSGEKKEDFQ